MSAVVFVLVPTLAVAVALLNIVRVNCLVEVLVGNMVLTIVFEGIAVGIDVYVEEGVGGTVIVTDGCCISLRVEVRVLVLVMDLVTVDVAVYVFVTVGVLLAV